MKHLKLVTKEVNMTSHKYLHLVVENNDVIVSHPSNKKYVACIVMDDNGKKYIPHAFSRYDLIGKGKTKYVIPKAYALAVDNLK